MDLTQKRCLSKASVFSARVAAYYEKAFPKQAADDQFWTEVDRLDDELGKAFEKRPLGNMEVDQLLARFGEGFKAAAKEARARASRTTPA